MCSQHLFGNAQTAALGLGVIDNKSAFEHITGAGDTCKAGSDEACGARFGGRDHQSVVAEAERLEAEAKDRALFAEQMIGIVSHDLRNPLSAVSTGIHVLFKHAPTDSQARVLSRMAQSVDRANRLVSDLLDFTVVRVGKGIAISPRPIDLHEVVAQSVAELALSFPERALRHETEGAGACRLDPDRIAQLVGNLVANAVAYGDQSRVVTVRTSVTPQQVDISVHNWRLPIPSELISVLFHPMVRGSAATAGRSVGLGLFIIMGIAKAHGGHVIVESSIENGTTFITTLPVS